MTPAEIVAAQLRPAEHVRVIDAKTIEVTGPLTPRKGLCIDMLGCRLVVRFPKNPGHL